MFETTLWKVAGLLLMMVPGYIVMKLKIAKEQDLKGLSVNLLYVVTPFMMISAFSRMEFNWGDVWQICLFLVISALFQTAMLLAVFLAVRKKHNETDYRVMVTEAALGNVAYFGVPIVASLFPDQPMAVVFATVSSIGMCTLGFTFGEYAVTNETKYISLKQVLLNPTSIGFYIAVPLYIFGAKKWMPQAVLDTFQSFSNAAAPLSMTILGMRLASAPLREIFKNRLVYRIMLLKLLVFPLAAFAAIYFLPLSAFFKSCMLIVCAAPVASLCLSVAEKHDAGQRLAANGLLLSTIASVVTIPLVALLTGLF